MVSVDFQQQTPVQNRNQIIERTTHKRPRNNTSPPSEQQAKTHRQEFPIQHQMTHPSPISKISFPPIVVKFSGGQQPSIKEITDDLISKWKNQHGIDLILTARFGHMHSLLVFDDDSSTFESLLDPNRWPNFKSIDDVKTLIQSARINVGSMMHPVKPYHLPIRINKCLKCLRHDHTTSSCIRPRLRPICAEERSLEHECPNKEKCINCEDDHASGHSACPIVQEKPRALLDQSKKQRAELLVLAERQQHRYDYHRIN
jgi:hypothetical protein